MTKHRITGLSDDEKEYLTKQLNNYRIKKAEKEKLNRFYQDTITAHGFDALGRFESYFETGLERVVWTIWDERKEGYEACVQYHEGDQITLLDASGAKIREPITLDSRSTVWAEYHEMHTKLGIDPKSYNTKYYVGLTKNKKKKHKK